jgi:hypothetical protein
MNLKDIMDLWLREQGGSHGSGGSIDPAGRAKSSGLCQKDGASRPYDSSGTHGTWHMGQKLLVVLGG